MYVVMNDIMPISGALSASVVISNQKKKKKKPSLNTDVSERRKPVSMLTISLLSGLLWSLDIIPNYVSVFLYYK